MLALAAARLGLKTCIYSDEANVPAFQVTPLQVAASYDDRTMLTGFAQICDVITFEFENLPADSLAYLAGLKPLRPGPRALQTTQDRLTEKNFVRSLGPAHRALRGGERNGGGGARGVCRDRRTGHFEDPHPRL